MQSVARKPTIAKSVTQAEQAAKPSLITVQRGKVIGRGHTGLDMDHAQVCPSACDHTQIYPSAIQDRPQTRLKSLIKH
jgi:hypothetical protein